MQTNLLMAVGVWALLSWPLAPVHAANSKPYRDGRFQGRIAHSADGNHNDPDDWIASPVTLAILPESRLKDRLVHFDYNSILPLTDPQWEKAHPESVLGAAERYGFASEYTFTGTKRSVIEQDVHWVQIADQNRLLSFGHYGTFVPLPKLAIEPLLKLWEHEVFALLLSEGKTIAFIERHQTGVIRRRSHRPRATPEERKPPRIFRLQEKTAQLRTAPWLKTP